MADVLREVVLENRLDLLRDEDKRWALESAMERSEARERARGIPFVRPTIRRENGRPWARSRAWLRSTASSSRHRVSSSSSNSARRSRTTWPMISAMVSRSSSAAIDSVSPKRAR